MKTKARFVSKEVDELEATLKERYGKKRGAAMIVDARQCAEYECDSPNFSQTEFIRRYTLNLKNKL